MNEIFANRLKELRKSKGLTQQQLADKINSDFYELNKKVSRESIAKYELGYTSPNIETISALACELGVDYDYLLGKTSHKNVYLADKALTELSALVNKIISEDNKDINEYIYKIIYSITNSIDNAYKCNFIDNLCGVYYITNKYTNIAINSNDSNIIVSLEENITKNLKNFMLEEQKKIHKKYNDEKAEIILKLIELDGINWLTDSEKNVLKEYYSNNNIEDIPKCIQYIFKNIN